jgi:predicted O-methyltransferase YrrM
MFSDKQINQAIVDGNRRILDTDAKLLIRACDETKAKNIIEIGSFDGGSSIILGSWAKLYDAKLWCIEPFPTARFLENIKKYKIENNICLIQDSSPKAVAHINNFFFDVLFIDGDHRTSHTIADFVAFAPLLKVGGIWVQHDWCGRANKRYPNNKSVKDMIRRAIDIILEDFPGCFEEFDRSESNDRGAIAFKKVKEMEVNLR